jgi:hypothetical protein
LKAWEEATVKRRAVMSVRLLKGRIEGEKEERTRCMTSKCND